MKAVALRLWDKIRSEPVYVLGIVTAIIGTLTAFKVVTAVEGGAILAIATAIGAPVVRGQVTPAVHLPVTPPLLPPAPTTPPAGAP